MSEDYTINAAKTVAVATNVSLNYDMTKCPRGVKLQLLGEGGVLAYSDYHGDKFWKAWCPLPKR